MTVKLETSIKRYTGVSRDKKPVPYSLGGTMKEGQALPTGSVFYEVDTGKEARWDGAEWVSQPSVPALLGEVIKQLEEIGTLLRKSVGET